MPKSDTISVRLDPQARIVLTEAASRCGAAGVSALARQILERWAERQATAETRASVDRAVSFLQEHPDGWPDEPVDFFPQAGP